MVTSGCSSRSGLGDCVRRVRSRQIEKPFAGCSMPSPSDAIRAYRRGKDGNRPHLLSGAFAPAAAVEMIVKTPAISFPSMVTGLDAIADVLVRRFALTYENVYTFCLSSPPSDDSHAFSC